jgi:hypothetical protein
MVADGLTLEQEQIVFAPIDSKQLVTADAGTGKTYALLARLDHLIEEEGLSPGHEVLLLSFSRAAVGEIRRRAKARGGDLAYVRAQTFDSFATAFLSRVVPGGSWQERGYDGRIESAVRALLEEEEAREEIEEFRHVFVDEIQDLVGVRMDLVEAVLDLYEGGFTLFGDPAQGIYNFQAEGDARKEGSSVLFAWIRSRFRCELIERSLTENFRAKTDVARSALFAGRVLNGPEPDYQDIRYQLDTVIEGLSTIGRVERSIPFLRNFSTSTAILCRTNVQALSISERLREAEVPHAYRRAATDRVVPPWVAEVFGEFPQIQIGRSSFLRRMSEIVPSEDAEACWRLLKRMAPGPGDVLDFTRVNEKLRQGNVPDDLNLGQTESLTVSTIHRAKGLEFDRIILIEPRDAEDVLEEDYAEEVRLIYVGLTRPQRQLIHMDSPNVRGYRSKGTPDERWMKRGKPWQTFRVEVRADDVHSAHPAGSFVIDADVKSVQDYLSTKVAPGDSLTLTLLKKSVEGIPRAFYVVDHNGVAIGVTAERFGGVLFRILKVNPKWIVNWPIRIEKLHLEAVETVAGTSAAGSQSGLGPTGLWLRPRIYGLGKLVYPNSKEA